MSCEHTLKPFESVTSLMTLPTYGCTICEMKRLQDIEAAARAVAADDRHITDCAAYKMGFGCGPCDCPMRELRAALDVPQTPPPRVGTTCVGNIEPQRPQWDTMPPGWRA